MLAHTGVFAPFVVNSKHNQTNNSANHKQQNQTSNISMSATAKPERQERQALRISPNTHSHPSQKLRHHQMKPVAKPAITASAMWLTASHPAASALPASIELVFYALLTFWASPHSVIE